MHHVMTGQEFDRSSGVQGLLTRGQQARRASAAAAGAPTATDLLAGAAQPVDPAGSGRAYGPVATAVPAPAGVERRPVVVPPGDVEVVLDPRWLADLDDPTLVISPGYVGPDRRRFPRTWDDPGPARSPWAEFVRRVGQVVLLTLAVVVPLAMIATHSVPPATRAPATGNQSAAGAAPGAARGRRAAHTFGATPEQVARADAAYQRALARQESVPASGAATGSSTATRPARQAPATGAVAQATQERAAAQAQAAQQRAAAQAQAAQERAAAQAQATQERAAAQAQAAQERAAAAASRAAIRSARSAAGDPGTTDPGAGGTGTPGGGASAAPAAS